MRSDSAARSWRPTNARVRKSGDAREFIRLSSAEGDHRVEFLYRVKLPSRNRRANPPLGTKLLRTAYRSCVHEHPTSRPHTSHCPSAPK